MSDAKDVKFSVKLVTNKDGTRLLFGEVDSDFVDVLLSFLTLPLGKIVKILRKHRGDEEAPIIGSLSTLYDGLVNLDSSHFTKSSKEMLLNPRSSFETECRKLKLNIDDTEPAKYFSCEDVSCRYPRNCNIGMYYDTAICLCGKSLKREVTTVQNQAASGVFTVVPTTFVLSAYHQMLPNVTGSVIQILKDLGIRETHWGKLTHETYGFKEIIGVLRRAVSSPGPSTDLKGHKKRKVTPKSGPEVLSIKSEKDGPSKSKKMILKVVAQKSANKILFAQAEEDFIDLLFSFLSIPLGGVEWLLGNSTSMIKIDNLYSSIVDLDLSTDIKNRLIEPKLPCGYLSKHQIFPLLEERAWISNYIRDETCSSPSKESVLVSYLTPGSCVSSTPCKSPRGGDSFVKGPRMFMVKDDLTVTPLCMASYLSILKEREIPLPDVEELEVEIGLEEALSILKASLTSTCASSHGLIHILEKQQWTKQGN